MVEMDAMLSRRAEPHSVRIELNWVIKPIFLVMVSIFHKAVLRVPNNSGPPRCLTRRPSEDNTTRKHLIEYQVRVSMLLAALVGYVLAQFARSILSSSPGK